MSAPSSSLAPPTTGRLVRLVLVAFLPSAVAGAWLFAAGTGLRGPALLQAAPWLVLVGAVAVVQAWLTSGHLVSHLSAAAPGEAPDAWLARVAELPRKIELFAIAGVGVVAGGLAGAISTLAFDATWAAVPLSAAVGLVLSLVPGVAGFAAVEREVRSFTSEKAAREPSPAGGTTGFFRMRRRVHLPYAFGAAAVAPVVAAVALLSTRGAGLWAAAEAIAVAAVLLAGACAAGSALARREADAAGGISAALAAALAGEPGARVLTSTDELGEAGAAAAQVVAELATTVVALRAMAAGDYGREVEGRSEVTALLRALRAGTGELAASLRTMAGGTQSVARSVGDIVVSLQATAAQLSAATTEQVAAVTETANTMTEMAQTSAVSADRAGELIRQGDAASSVAEEGNSAVEAAVNAMAAICGTLDKAAQAAGALAERVKKIDDVTERVSFLADQSSTLAINAAIEAARAGEAGKGFAVVAREVRSLAADSRKATAEIRDILGEIRDRAGEVDESVGTGFRSVEDGSRLVQRMGEVMGQLGVTVHEAVGLMRQVEGSARQHQAGVGQVSQALTNLQKASESNRDAARLLGELSTKAHDLSEELQRTAGAYAAAGKDGARA